MVLNPFGGAGTTAVVAIQEGRKSILCELKPNYAALAERRIATTWLDGAAQMDVFRDSTPAASSAKLATCVCFYRLLSEQEFDHLPC
ncbi:DNA methyltransferase [Pseudomonas sp. P1.31]|uniref:DNA methyltransferase n=1 Tax=Pseudomonas sp. P1.31 TaxID=1699311 RepID=UPI0009EADB0C